jgi:hypothetical protein
MHDTHYQLANVTPVLKGACWDQAAAVELSSISERRATVVTQHIEFR